MSIPKRHSRPENIVTGSRTFFITSSTCGRCPLLQSERSAQLFIRTLYECRAQKRFQLHEFVVMPDHFHLLLTVDRQTSVERAVQFIKGGFSFRASKELGLHAPVWQKGFSEFRILDFAAFSNGQNYIHHNPVRRGLVSQPELYAHSSAHPGFDLDPCPQRLKPSSRLIRHG